MNRVLTEIKLRNDTFSYTHAVMESPNDSRFNIHTHRQRYEIYYLISGSVDYQVEDQTYSLSPGDLLIINNKESHRPYFTSEASYERILIFFSPEFCSHYNQETYAILQYFERKKAGSFNRLPGKMVEQLAGYFSDMEELQRSHHPARNLLIEMTFIRLLIHLNEIVSANIHTFELEMDYNAKIEQILDYMHTNMYRPLTLQTIEDLFFINRHYFSHLFKKTTGFSFKQYIIHKRITKAIELLKMSVPPSEVCRMTGFEDYSNFYKAFKKSTGTSPARYV
ncbi:AraC family transcriptional regulator [Paenibacillus oryzisoli]|uniref:helix-turn-helix domain-containing protein n=1 Tax=Paenibacillus oryzisoli TaxID=1850517 RepID=UPI003D2E5AD8